MNTEGKNYAIGNGSSKPNFLLEVLLSIFFLAIIVFSLMILFGGSR
jgi:hypothetical protein